MKRKTAGLILLFCLVAPLLATFTFLHFQKLAVRKEVKHRMIAGIDKNDLVLLKFTTASLKKLRWEHSEEFEYQAQMYDVVEKETSGDTTYFWCWEDDDESELNKKLDELVASIIGNSSEKKEGQQLLSDFYKNLYCHSDQLVSDFSGNETLNFPAGDRILISICDSPPVPPPRS